MPRCVVWHSKAYPLELYTNAESATLVCANLPAYAESIRQWRLDHESCLLPPLGRAVGPSLLKATWLFMNGSSQLSNPFELSIYRLFTLQPCTGFFTA